MSKPKRHHLVPAFYLRRFADSRERIALHHRKTGSTKIISVKDAAVGVSFYTVTDEDGGTSERIETSILQKIEDRAATALERLLKGRFPPSKEDRSDLAMFIAFQALRGRSFDHQIRAVGDITAKMIFERTTREDLERPLPDGRVPSEEEIEAALFVIQNPDKFTVESHPNDRIRMMLQLADTEFYPRLFQMSWILVHSRKPRFVTSDSPVVYWRQPSEIDQFMGIGLETADEIRFPLDPHHALVLVPAPIGDRRFEVEPAVATSLARHVAAWSFDYVFHHPKHDKALREFTLAPDGPRVSYPDRFTKPRTDKRTS